MSTTIRFLGAAETVTGSRYLIDSEHSRVLVDCGLFQGYEKLRARNWESVPFEPSSLDAVILTHAHIDHSGYLPKLCRMGFSGAIYCTPGTRDLLEILLPDSAHLQEEDARRANRYGYTRHHPAAPLYNQRDVKQCLRQLMTSGYDEQVEVAPKTFVRFARAGHILGSATVEVDVTDTTVTFTGDVGRPNDPVIKPAAPLRSTDFLVTESTYGDRRHSSEPADELLARVVNETADRGGVVLVPAFAVGRAQHLLHTVAELKAAGRIADIPVFLDSPMAINATRLFCAHKEDHEHSDAQCHAMCEAAHYTSTPRESKALALRAGPQILISASGMATGGRILHHLKRLLPEARNTVLFAGFQAAGTRGRALVDGTDEVKIHGQYVPVRARIVQAHGLSAHADYREMLDWLAAGDLEPQRVFVTHGEPAAADAFCRRLRDTFGWDAVVPEMGATFPLRSSALTPGSSARGEAVSSRC